MRSLQRHGISLIGLVLLLGSATPAAAVLTQWNFEGVVRDCTSGGPCPQVFTDLGVDIGAPLSGYVLMDDTVSGTVLDADRTQYNGAVLAGEFQVGGLTLTLNQPGGITVAQNANTPTSPPEGTAVYRIFTGGLTGVTTSPSVATDLSALAIDLVDDGQDLITNQDFPTFPPALAALAAYNPELRAFFTHFIAVADGDVFYAEITSLSATVVPEPGTAVLVGLGLTALTIARRRA